MRLHHLRVTSFGAIENVDVKFGPGLNILYGPNDLGKSTMVAAIRLGLLLPHASTHSERYVAWTGSGDPTVELTFETEAQRIWRVRKQFGKDGSSLLHESRNGRDFDEVEKGRKVDGRLREILRWGIPEPGGAGGAKGLPTSFLATVLLTPQDEVDAVLGNSLQDDLTATGKEQIAAALQAVAQDPLFGALLKETQARRDAAYTEGGAKKTAKGSVFKAAAERLNETRQEKERLERIVADSEGAETLLRTLTQRRTQNQGALAAATELADKLARLAEQAACRSIAAEQVELAKKELERIQRIETETEESERKTGDLSRKIVEAEQALDAAKARQTEAGAALKNAEEAAHAEGSDSGVTDTVVRQELELRKAAADRAARDGEQRIASVAAAEAILQCATTAERDFQDQETRGRSAAEAVMRSATRLAAAEEALRRCDQLERALDLQAADKRVAEAQAAVDRRADLNRRLETASSERARLAGQRAAITVPAASALGPMRRLAQDLAAARGALDVGVLVTVTRKSRFDLRVRKDGQEVKLTSSSQSVDIEGRAEVELGLGDFATVSVRAGRREAQGKVKNLEDRWNQEVAPYLVAAGVTDLAGLDAKSEEAHQLDSLIRARDTELESLRAQFAELDGAAAALREATARAESCRGALGVISVDELSDDLRNLGRDAVAGLRKRREKASIETNTARTATHQAENERTLADERVRRSRQALAEAVAARDRILPGFPEGLAPALSTARSALAAANEEIQRVSAGVASLDSEIEGRKRRIDEALSGARTNAAQAEVEMETAQTQLMGAKTNHATEHGRLVELRKQRDAENRAAAAVRLQEAIASHAALPVPERRVSDEEVSAARTAAAALQLELEGIEREILRAHGALEQVGGSVARERLRDAMEAFNLASRQEREIEAEYEAWKLLLEQMKEADAAQASNLGQALGPAIASRFQELTRRRYQALQLTAQLATDGLLVGGMVRSTEQISVGTREQLSTLYRLCLAEYLGSTIVLDDQLVQSDDNRMNWFRALLTEKARTFQVLVFTCRPGDYLAKAALVPEGGAIHADSDEFVRAVDLGRAIQHRPHPLQQPT